MTKIRKAVAPFSKMIVRLLKSQGEKEEISKEGIYLGSKSERDLELEQQGMTYGYVIDMGPCVGWRSWFKGRSVPCKLGDKILLNKYAGTLLEDLGDGLTYRVIEDLNIECVFPEEGIEI